jgi:hypothetical protein
MPSSPGLLFNECKVDGKQVKYDLKEILKELMCWLISDFDLDLDYPPAVITSWDEAHLFTKIHQDLVDGPWSIFTEIRRMLRVFHSYPCFSVFLSTMAKMQAFTPQALKETSSRLQRALLCVPHPFCELGFDQLAEKVQSGITTLEHVSSLKFMARLGRPL